MAALYCKPSADGRLSTAYRLRQTPLRLYSVLAKHGRCQDWRRGGADHGGGSPDLGRTWGLKRGVINRFNTRSRTQFSLDPRVD
jgi:hypothetical protein